MDIDAFLALFVSTTAVFSVFLLLLVLKLGRQPYHYTYAMIQVVVILFLLGYVSDVYSPTVEEKLLWNNLEYFGNLFIPLLSLMFAMQFSRIDNATVNKVVLVLAVASFALLAGMATNSYHGLVYTSVTLADDPLRSFDAEHGPLFYPIVMLMIAEMVAACSIVWKRYNGAARMLKTQYRTLLVSLLAPTILSCMLVPFWHKVPPTTIMIGSILASCLVLFLGILYYDMFRAVPFTIDAVVRSSKDGMLVLDDRNQPLYMNTIAASLMGVSADDVIEVPVNEILPTIPSRLLGNGPDPANSSMSDVELVPGRSFDISVNKMLDPKGCLVGHVMILHDMTEVKTTARRMAATLKKMGTMNRISRYDLANEVMMMGEVLSLVEKDHHADAIRCARVREILRSMDLQLAFMKDYQGLGEMDPRWHDVDYAFRSVAQSLRLDGVEARSSVKIEVLADPMFAKVFHILLENSLQHGGDVTRVDLTLIHNDDGILLIYTDDGKGIPEMQKPLLFQGSFGGSHGYGLFLCKEVLDITGIKIFEDGLPGEGARFKILVPNDRFRPVMK